MRYTANICAQSVRSVVQHRSVAVYYSRAVDKSRSTQTHCVDCYNSVYELYYTLRTLTCTIAYAHHHYMAQ
jgi:hypothetical protein